MIIVGGPKGDWFAPLMKPLGAAIVNPFVDQKLATFVARMRQADLQTLADMMERGEVTSSLDTTYSLDQIADAIRHSESGRARGKIIVAID